MRVFRSAVPLWLVLAGWTGSARASFIPSGDLPSALIDAKFLIPGGDGHAATVAGSISYSGLRTAAAYCFYLPYEDQHYGARPDNRRRFEVFSAQTGASTYRQGSTAVTVGRPFAVTFDREHSILRLVAPSGWDAAQEEIHVEFQSQVPVLPGARSDDFFVEGFYPQLLTACPGPDAPSPRFPTPAAVRLKARLATPDGLTYAGPGISIASETIVDMPTRSYAFALGTGYQQSSFVAGTTPVTLYYRTREFAELVPTIQKAVAGISLMFGPFPFPTLTVIESTELQPHGLAGVIALNRPSQTVFERVQRSWLNWQHWIVTMQIAAQWYGAAIAPAVEDDHWLLSGIVEFATLATLAADPLHFDLFSQQSGGGRLLSLTYLQAAEIMAATLQKHSPFATLTDERLVSRQRHSSQHPLLFVKQMFAMRQLAGATGTEAYSRFLRILTEARIFKELTPKQYFDQHMVLPSPFPAETRETIAKSLARWWVDEGWPDLSLSDEEITAAPAGGWMTEAQVESKGAIDFQPLVGVKLPDGSVQTARARPDQESGRWRLSLPTAEKPQAVIVDPAHETFDSDRFNNRSGWPRVNFFPGNASNLADDAYTLVWLPYALRHPAEPLAIGVQAAVFRYIQSNSTLRVESAPSTGDTAYEAAVSSRNSKYALATGVRMERTFDRDRTLEATLARSPVLPLGPRIDMGLRIRRKDLEGDRDSAHSTWGGNANIRSDGIATGCGGFASADFERAPDWAASDFSYVRRHGVVSGSCRLLGTARLGVRGFAGRVDTTGDPPPSALFKPTDLKEARLRLDIRGLSRPQRIRTASLDLGLPFYAPIPQDTLVLARHLQWRLFYDRGEAELPETTYASAGAGFELPFGGDLSGAGTLSLTRLSVLGILYSQVNHDRSHRPSVVFDLTGEL